ncbi:diaminobutyrate acetyltransferase [Alkalispirillum mobile]|uniref:L-2,4-diaminobutyric acid acetyltransferase n=1 Tax=Alkalispirillum mobile TaxID=85925 RepID=A0A498CAZ7_9GAMM|nr:diaminobutyrate acetyltransferase [Alkalispirillum mobile]RLK50160.1 diaminobutyrate acetyltransferase [Alkalispirillum mobile]
MSEQNAADGIVIRTPTIDDGGPMWRVVRDSGVLDLNSSYLYLLMATDFAETSVVAEMDGRVVGFVIGYRPPQRPDSIFLWQVGVDEAARGKGLGKRLLRAFLAAPGARGARLLETTISPSNAASRALFAAIARELGVDNLESEHFSEAHFLPDEGHEPEMLFRIGPLDPETVQQRYGDCIA